MSDSIQIPPNYTLYNDLQSKKLAIVVDIDGVDYLTSTTIGRPIRYGDAITYGESGIIYGGLVPIGFNAGERGQKELLNLDRSSLTIAQRLEPEQGRASVSTLALSFIDKDSYMTQVITPGFIVPEILGRQVRVWVGYAQLSFPDDYFIVWRGRISQVNPEEGVVSFQFSDANMGKRQNVFFNAKTQLLADITSSSTTIPVISNGDFYEKILGPDGTYDSTTAKVYIKIEDEFIEYQQAGSEATGFGTNSFNGVLRGQRSTTAVAHTAGTDVEAYIQLEGHAIDLALKLQLSGWGGPYKTGQSIYGFVQTGGTPSTVNSAIILPFDTDAIRDLGIAIGDYITVTGATNPLNNGTFVVEGFQDIGTNTNRAVVCTGTITAEYPTTATIAIRSQFDTLPKICGTKLPGWEVDVLTHIYYYNTYLSNPVNSYSFLISDVQSCKTFIESEIMLPIGAYCLTRQGRLSMGLTKPPIADQYTTVLDADNVLNPMGIKQQRGTNNRKFFNEITWEYDYDDAGTARKVRKTIDTDSLNLIGVSSTLPIKAKGAKTVLGFQTVVEDRERLLLLRYALGAVMLDMQVTYGAGNQIEAGNVVIVSDQGRLQIPNMVTGERNYGQQMLEVINRSIDFKTGVVSLTLLGGLQSLVNDRYATVSPSSRVAVAGSTTTQVKIADSYGVLYPLNEQKKWVDYIGLDIVVHSDDYTTRYGVSKLIGIDPGDNHILLLDPATPLAFTPQPDDTVEIEPYPTGTDPLENSLYKLIHAFADPSVAVLSGVSTVSFYVGAGDAAKFMAGQYILVHNSDYTILSPEVIVLSVVGALITVDSSLGFTPAFGQTVELIGFADGNGPYRLI